ncbi:MAG: rRNA maturation RNase YbeY [Clostridiales bacterium]|jgi:probable rRNA maturation factor|nr:rRNA maturation RNase YbeY [Clostridiales bacterium]
MNTPCKIDILYNTTSQQNFDAQIKEAIASTLKLLNFTTPCAVSVAIVDEPEIHNLNLNFRNINAPTDVLSFPSGELITTPAGTPAGTPDDDNSSDNDTPITLGDIIICLPIAQKQADSLAHSTSQEVQFLTIHSMLHLFGYNHIRHNDEEAMTKLQREIIASLHSNER